MKIGFNKYILQKDSRPRGDTLVSETNERDTWGKNIKREEEEEKGAVRLNSPSRHT